MPRHQHTTLKTQTHKGEGGKELRFEDEVDKEQIYIHAQRDLDLLTENNRTEVIMNDSHLTIENDHFSHTRNNSHTTVDGEKRKQTGKGTWPTSRRRPFARWIGFVERLLAFLFVIFMITKFLINTTKFTF